MVWSPRINQRRFPTTESPVLRRDGPSHGFVLCVAGSTAGPYASGAAIVDKRCRHNLGALKSKHHRAEEKSGWQVQGPGVTRVPRRVVPSSIMRET